MAQVRIETGASYELKYEQYTEAIDEFTFTTGALLSSVDLCGVLVWTNEAVPVYKELLRTRAVEIGSSLASTVRVKFLDLSDSSIRAGIVARTLKLQPVLWNSNMGGEVRKGLLKFQRPSIASENPLTAVEIEIEQIKRFGKGQVTLPQDAFTGSNIIRYVNSIVLDAEVLPRSDVLMHVIDSGGKKRLRLRKANSTQLPTDVTLVLTVPVSATLPALADSMWNLYTDDELKPTADPPAKLKMLAAEILDMMDANDVQNNVMEAVRTTVAIGVLARPGLRTLNYGDEFAAIQALCTAYDSDNVCIDLYTKLKKLKDDLAANVEYRRKQSRGLLNALSEDTMAAKLAEIKDNTSKLQIREQEVLRAARKAYITYMLLWLSIMLVSLMNIVAIMVFSEHISKVLCVILIFGFLLGFVAVMVFNMTQEKTLV